MSNVISLTSRRVRTEPEVTVTVKGKRYPRYHEALCVYWDSSSGFRPAFDPSSGFTPEQLVRNPDGYCNAPASAFITTGEGACCGETAFSCGEHTHALSWELGEDGDQVTVYLLMGGES